MELNKTFKFEEHSKAEWTVVQEEEHWISWCSKQGLSHSNNITKSMEKGMPPKYKWDIFLMGWYRCAVFCHVFSF